MPSNQAVALEMNFKSWCESRFPDTSKKGQAWEYYCAEQFARPFDLGDSQLKAGIVGASQDGGVDVLYVLANGEIVDVETEINPKEPPAFKLLLMQIKSNEGFSPKEVDKLYWFIDDLLDLSKGKADYHSTYHADVISMMRLFKDKFGIVVGESPSLEIDFVYVIQKDVEQNEDCNKSANAVSERCSHHFQQVKSTFTFANASRVWDQVQSGVRPVNWRVSLTGLGRADQRVSCSR